MKTIFTPPAVAFARPTVASNPVPVTDLFQGFDTFSGSARATALTGKFATSATTVFLTSTVCNTMEKLYKALDLSASLAVSGIFGSIDARAKLVGSTNATAMSVSIVVKATVEQTLAYTDVSLKGEVPKDLAEFYRGYGDSFVSQLTVGGQYFAVYTFHSQSVTEKKEVEAELKASGLISGALSGDLKAKLETARSSSSVQSSMQQTITGVKSSLPKEEDIITFALDFPKLTMDNDRTVLSFDTTGYESVPRMPRLGNIAVNRRRFEGGETPGIAAQMFRLFEVDQQCRYIQAMYQPYGYAEDTNLAEKAAENERDRVAARAWLDHVEDDPTRTYPDPEFASLGNGYPSVKVARMNGPVWGTAGDPVFGDVLREPGIAKQSILSIRIRGGDWVDALMVEYSFGSAKSPRAHGGNGGALSPELQLEERNDVITSITALTARPHHGDVISSLTFKTREGQTLRWPQNPGLAGAGAEWPVPKGWMLAGFDGAAGRYLTRLQPVLKGFGPADWVEFSAAPK